MASKKYTVKLNLQDYLNDNKIGLIDETTKLLVGHDLATGAKLSSALNSRFKELITNEAFMVDVKYKNAKFVQSRSLKIQSTNTLLIYSKIQTLCVVELDYFNGQIKTLVN